MKRGLAPETLPGIPHVDSPLFETIFATADPTVRRVAEDLRRDGYAVIDFPEPELDAAADAIVSTLTPRLDFDHWRRALWPNGQGLRAPNAWDEVDAVRRIACNARILDLLGAVYGRRAFPFQTINFPVGTQQHFHSDAVHFSSVPNGFMCGVWLALEDMDADNGPLLYYPGSHRLPMITNDQIGVRAREEEIGVVRTALKAAWEKLVEQHGLSPVEFHARKGQALIWSAHLLHGGAPHLDPARTRWSQVTHYYFDDCAYWTPLESDLFAGTISFREPVDLTTGKRMSNRYLGAEMDRDYITSVLPPFNVIAPRDDTPPSDPTRSGAGWKSRLGARFAAMTKGFDADAYLSANPDVRAVGMPAYEHWLKYGYAEGRRLR